MVSKHFFFELTGILLNFDQLLTLLYTPRVVTYRRVKKKKILNYRGFSHDVTAAILVSQINEMVVMLVPQTNPVGVELFSNANTFFAFQ